MILWSLMFIPDLGSRGTKTPDPGSGFPTCTVWIYIFKTLVSLRVFPACADTWRTPYMYAESWKLQPLLVFHWNLNCPLILNYPWNPVVTCLLPDPRMDMEKAMRSSLNRTDPVSSGSKIRNILSRTSSESALRKTWVKYNGLSIILGQSVCYIKHIFWRNLWVNPGCFAVVFDSQSGRLTTRSHLIHTRLYVSSTYYGTHRPH